MFVYVVDKLMDNHVFYLNFVSNWIIFTLRNLYVCWIHVFSYFSFKVFWYFFLDFFERELINFDNDFCCC